MMFLALLLATFFSAMTNSWIEHERSQFSEKYTVEDNRYYLTNEHGEQSGDGVIISKTEKNYSEADQRKNRVYGLVTFISVPFYFIVFILVAGLFFYRWKIQRPLSILGVATSKIALQDLDFSIHYSVDDEMGKLVASFEKMRHALYENNKVLWHTAEERKRVNAAFAHDLRTPLTVLKGYNSFILANMNDERFTKQKLQSTSQLMEQQIHRLEAFVESMYSVQRLEQLSINKKETPNQFIQLAIEETTNILDNRNIVDLITGLGDSRLQLDVDMVLQVYENLLNNALRYAEHRITVMIERNDIYLTIQIEDDGPGFDNRVLQYAPTPFFRISTEESETNFGLGLYICKVLCEKHGGELKISNGDKGAKIVASFIMD